MRILWKFGTLEMPGSAINSPLLQVSHFKLAFKNTFHNGVFVLMRSNVDIKFFDKGWIQMTSYSLIKVSLYK